MSSFSEVSKVNFNQKYLKLITFVLVIIGLWFVRKLFLENYSVLMTYNWSISYKHFTFGLLFILVRLYIRSLIFSSILNKELIEKYGLKKIVFSYSLSQIVKYIPGKFFGILSQSLHLTGTMITKSLWNAHVLHYLYEIFNSGVILLTLFFAFYNQNFLLSILVIPLSFSTLFFIKHKVFSRFFNYFINFLSNKIKLYEAGDATWKIVFLLNIELLFFFTSWVFFIPDKYTLIQAVGIGVSYEFAALLGAIVFILPSGIIIREALFISIGLLLGYDKEMLIIYSILMRIVFTAADIVFGFLCYMCFLFTNKSYNINEK